MDMEEKAEHGTSEKHPVQMMEMEEKAEHGTSEKHPVQTMEMEEKAEHGTSEKHPADEPTAKPEGENGQCSPLVLAESMQWRLALQDFAQIVISSRLHWVCVPNTLSSPSVVDAYDSIPAYYTWGSIAFDNRLRQWQTLRILQSPSGLSTGSGRTEVQKAC